MAEKFSPVFNVNSTYSRDDFIFRMESSIADGFDQNCRFVQMVNSQIIWARSLPENALVTFEIHGDIIYPVSSVSLNIPINGQIPQ